MRNVAELLKERAEEGPHAEHVRFKQGDGIARLTRREFSRLAASWGAALKDRGIGRGDRVGLVSEKSASQMRAFFAILEIGGVVVPVAEELPEAEIALIFSDADLALILSSPACAEKVIGSAGRVPVLTFDALPEGPGGEYVAGPAEPGDVACIIYTSGSTGRPKGVMLTHRNFLANSESAARLIEAGQGDVVLSILPYWHSFALTVELFTLLQARGAVAIPRDKRDFARCMADYEPTIVLIVPRVAEVLRRGVESGIETAAPWKRRLLMRALRNGAKVCTDDPVEGGTALDRLMRRLYLRLVLRPIKDRFGGRLRFFVSGGAPLDKEYQVLFKRLGVPIYQGYGLTESTPVVSASNPVCHRLGSAGKIASWLTREEGGDFTFEGPDGRRGKDLRGELLLRGECVMAGYFRREEETARALSEGWLHTGDIGWVDSDNFLFLSGRASSLVCLSGGEKFHPEPIEERLKTSPYIADCMVFGEGRKNAYALVVAHPEATAGMGPAEVDSLLKRDMARLLADSPSHWRPKDFALVEPFTVEAGLLTSTQKVKRAAILRHHAATVEAIDVRNGEGVSQPAVGY